MYNTKKRRRPHKKLSRVSNKSFPLNISNTVSATNISSHGDLPLNQTHRPAQRNQRHSNWSKFSVCPPSSLCVVISLIVALLASIALATLLVGVLVKPKLTTVTSVTTTSPSIRIFWSFDNSLNDLYNVYNGIGNSSPTFLSPGYNGAGACLELTSSLRQYVTINSPFLNLTYRSFTVSAWVYPSALSLTFNSSIFCQTDLLISYRALHLLIRQSKAHIGFHSSDTLGSQVLSVNQWYHLAFVYDYINQTQSIYVNGYLDNSGSPRGPYLGNSGSILIGACDLGTITGFFDGCLDSIEYVDRAKSASEVLEDATLVSYLPFDNQNLLDRGPLLINGTGVDISFSSVGRVGSALKLSSNWSYVQIHGLKRLGTVGWPYTLAIWINPSNLTGGTIIHISDNPNGASGWCLGMMSLTATGQIIVYSYNGTEISLLGPYVNLNQWTHVAATYASTNGLRLYIDGFLYGCPSPPFTFLWSNQPTIISLGSSLFGAGQCAGVLSLQLNQYFGLLDEFRVYARELTPKEIWTLANP